MSRPPEVPDRGLVRLGLAGLGWGARVAEAVRGLPGVRLDACFARSPGAREEFAARFGARPCHTWAELVAGPELDGVIIMTPNSTHRDLAVAALEAGKHVLVTKPIAASLDDAAAMIRAARAAGRILAVGHQSRRHPALRELKRRLDGGDIGMARRIEGNTSSPTGLGVAAADWRAQATECPGGPLTQLGIHYLDNFQHFLGPVRVVSARLSRAGTGPVDPDTAIVDLAFGDGATGRLVTSYVTPRARWIWVTGDRGTLAFEPDGSLVLERGRGQRTQVRGPVTDFDGVVRGMLAEEVGEFARSIRTGHPFETDGAAGARNLAVVLAAVESHRRSAPVAVADLLLGTGV